MRDKGFVFGMVLLVLAFFVLYSVGTKCAGRVYLTDQEQEFISAWREWDNMSSSLTYNRTTFNCVNFSNLAVEFFKSKNITARTETEIIKEWNVSNQKYVSKHMFIVLEFEPQTAQFRGKGESVENGAIQQ